MIENRRAGETADASPSSNHLILLKGATMSVPPNGLHTPPTRPPVRGLLIVARDQRDLYDCLQHAYGDSEEITVLLDRRQGERRRRIQPVAGERRYGERRSLLSIAEDLRYQQYVLVRPHFRRPHD
jgi:hypothetical protein